MEIKTRFIKKFVKKFLNQAINQTKKYDNFTLGLIIIQALKHILIPHNGILFNPKMNKYDRLMLDIINFYI